MKGIAYRIFNLYPGEARTALFFGILAFLWALSSYCAATLADGFFLEKVGAASLPSAFFFTSLGLFAFAFLSLKHLYHCRPQMVYMSLLAIALSGYAIFLLLFLQGHDSFPFWISLKSFCYIMIVLLTTSFWNLLDQYFFLQHAKRLYTLFNASIFLGNAFGSLLIVFGLGPLGFSGVLAIVIALGTACLLWTGYLCRELQPIQSMQNAHEASSWTFMSICRSFFSSRFTLLLMIGFLALQLLNVTTEFTYMQGLDKHFQNASTPDELTLFLSSCTAIVSFLNMIVGCFFYSRLVHRFGVNNMVLVSPLLFLGVFLGWSMTDTLLLAVLGLFTVEGVSYLIDENTSHLLLNAVPPRLKSRARLAIDSFFEPLGMLLGVIGFLFFNTRSLGLFLALLTLTTALIIRKHYKQAVLNNLLAASLSRVPLKERLARTSKKELKRCQLTLLGMLRQEESQKLFAFELLLAFCDRQLLPGMLQHTHALSIRGKRQIFRLLEKGPFFHQPQVVELFARWRAQLPPSHLKHLLDRYFTEMAPKEALSLENCFALLSCPKTILQALTTATPLLHPNDFAWADPLLNCLRTDESGEVRYAALQALSRIKRPELIESIFLASQRLRPKERSTLEKMIAEWGLLAKEPLVQLIEKAELSTSLRLSAARTLRRICSKTLQETVQSLFFKLLQRATSDLLHWKSITDHALDSEEAMLLQEALRMSFESTIDLIVQFLGIQAAIDESQWLSRALHSKNGQVRADALEMVEKICDAKFAKELRPLIDERPWTEKKQFCLKKIVPLQLFELLHHLTSSACPSVQAIVHRLQERLTPPFKEEERLVCPSEM